jgi:hypothetical protein
VSPGWFRIASRAEHMFVCRGSAQTLANQLTCDQAQEHESLPPEFLE